MNLPFNQPVCGRIGCIETTIEMTQKTPAPGKALVQQS
jgi:hypothetical protein